MRVFYLISLCLLVVDTHGAPPEGQKEDDISLERIVGLVELKELISEVKRDNEKGGEENAKGLAERTTEDEQLTEEIEALNSLREFQVALRGGERRRAFLQLLKQVKRIEDVEKLKKSYLRGNLERPAARGLWWPCPNCGDTTKLLPDLTCWVTGHKCSSKSEDTGGSKSKGPLE